MSVKVSYRTNRKRWEVDYFYQGKRKRPLFLEKAEADNFARKISLGLAPEDRNSITIDEAGKKYFSAESVRKSAKSRSNDKRYINLLFHFLTYERGLERLQSVLLEDMEAFREWLVVQKTFDGKPMAMGPSSINRCLRVLKHFFKKHIHWKNLESSPCEHLQFLDSEERPREVMSGDQLMRTLEVAPTWLKPALQFMYLTGSPAVCVERLQWSDVDFATRRYSTVRKKGRGARTKRTHFGMTDEVFTLLVTLRNQWALIEGAVFRDSDARPLQADRVTREGNDAIRLAGVKGVTLYGLRHALATDLTSANVATEIVRQAMGHASITTTQRYANKVSLRSIAGAIESVRGVKVVANDDFLDDALKGGKSS